MERQGGCHSLALPCKLRRAEQPCHHYGEGCSHAPHRLQVGRRELARWIALAMGAGEQALNMAVGGVAAGLQLLLPLWCLSLDHASGLKKEKK